MTVLMVQCCKCDVCGHVWIPGSETPKRCAKCKSMKWNLATKEIANIGGVKIEIDDSIPKDVIGIKISPPSVYKDFPHAKNCRCWKCK